MHSGVSFRLNMTHGSPRVPGIAVNTDYINVINHSRIVRCIFKDPRVAYLDVRPPALYGYH